MCLLKRRVERIQFSDEKGLPLQAFFIDTCSTDWGVTQMDLVPDLDLDLDSDLDSDLALNRHNSAPSGP